MNHKIFFMPMLLMCACISYAQTLSMNLDDINVLGEKTHIAGNVRNTITTISAEQIQALPATSVNELLDLLPGIDLRSRGANGAQADISLRGGTNDQVLILLNGINITDPRTGHANLDLPIDLASINRIEILKGTAIEQFGLNAFSGAINIITNDYNKADNQHMSHRISLAAGDHGYIAPSYTLKGHTPNTNWMASANYNRSAGFMHNTDYDYGNLYSSGVVFGEQSGLWQWQIGGQLKHFGSNAFYSLKYPDQYEKTKTLIASASWEKRINKWTLESNIYYRLHHDIWYLFRPGSEKYTDEYKPNRHLTQHGGINIKAHYHSPIGKTSMGIELRDENILSNVLGETRQNQPAGSHFDHQKNHININYFTQQIFVWADSWSAQVGVAGNYNTMFANNFTYNAQLSYSFAAQSSVYAGTNRALRLPTFTDLYYQSVTQTANPYLKPEDSYNFELGVKYYNRLSDKWQMQIEASAFYRIGNNIIDWIKQPAAEKWLSMNHTRVDATGAETSIRFSSNQWSITASYAFCHLNRQMQEAYSDYISKYALDYLRHKATIRFRHPIYKGFGGMWTFNYQQRHGDYIDVNDQVQRYKPVCLLDGRLFWHNNWAEVYIEGTNLLNLMYYDYGGIAQPRRWLKGGIVITL